MVGQQRDPNNPRVLALVGPTAAGKTELSLELAEQLGAAIISCDSMLVYRHMDIGTAKPTPSERARVQHYMIDIVDPDEEFTLTDYKQRVEGIIRECTAAGTLPMLVGGTGLYLRALLQDFPIINVPPDEELRQRLREEARELGRQMLHDRLIQVDPEAAERIHPNDLKRIIRALEVHTKTGKPISRAQKQTTPDSPYDAVKVGLRVPRQVLYSRINERVDQMMREGFLDEVRWLLDHGYTRDLYSMQSLGYRELAAYLEGEHSLEEAVRLIKRNTRHFARRQLSWFRKEPRLVWIDTHDSEKEYKGTRRLVEEVLEAM